MAQGEEEVLKTVLLSALAIAVAIPFGCSGEDARPISQSPLASMSKADKAFYGASFTTLATVPYGKCWPKSLYDILARGRKPREGTEFIRFAAPKKFRQNANYSEWMRVKAVTIEIATRRVVSAEGCVGPFKDDAAVQAYLDSTIRSDLNGQFFVVETPPTPKGEFRFVCESKYAGRFTIRIVLREDAHGLWFDVRGHNNTLDDAGFLRTVAEKGTADVDLVRAL